MKTILTITLINSSIKSSNFLTSLRSNETFDFVSPSTNLGLKL